MSTLKPIFSIPSNSKINWFPGHMLKAYRNLPSRISKVNILIEIRDARVPLSSGNEKLLQHLPPQAKHIIIFNKSDLCNFKETKEIIDRDMRNVDAKKVLLQATKHFKVKDILSLIKDNHNPKFETVGTWCMVCGIPNVLK